ncbi:hypothetical protein FRX31_025758 [Thalictrum thalictroides]|uniref:Uncharacterized protein n=1 Tax=Thalictrum thalictroides TaxID=46969 RepID=A0A7J6VKK5_THATH|nr:hypothetical protein FRX31_025758 [Thalictrum thalictroides]
MLRTCTFGKDQCEKARRENGIAMYDYKNKILNKKANFNLTQMLFSVLTAVQQLWLNPIPQEFTCGSPIAHYFHTEQFVLPTYLGRSSSHKA